MAACLGGVNTAAMIDISESLVVMCVPSGSGAGEPSLSHFFKEAEFRCLPSRTPDEIMSRIDWFASHVPKCESLYFVNVERVKDDWGRILTKRRNQKLGLTALSILTSYQRRHGQPPPLVSLRYQPGVAADYDDAVEAGNLFPLEVMSRSLYGRIGEPSLSALRETALGQLKIEVEQEDPFHDALYPEVPKYQELLSCPSEGA